MTETRLIRLMYQEFCRDGMRCGLPAADLPPYRGFRKVVRSLTPLGLRWMYGTYLENCKRLNRIPAYSDFINKAERFCELREQRHALLNSN